MIWSFDIHVCMTQSAEFEGLLTAVCFVASVNCTVLVIFNLYFCQCGKPLVLGIFYLSMVETWKCPAACTLSTCEVACHRYLATD